MTAACGMVKQSEKKKHELRALNQALFIDTVDQGPGKKAEKKNGDLAYKIINAG